MALNFYRAIAYQAPGEEPDDGWDVIFPEFLGCVSQGDTPQDAMANALEAVTLHVAGMIEEGKELPLPSRLNVDLPRWVGKIFMANEVHAFLPVPVPGASVRINVTMDEGLLTRMDRTASKLGTTRSGFLAKAVEEKLERGDEVGDTMLGGEAQSALIALLAIGRSGTESTQVRDAVADRIQRYVKEFPASEVGNARTNLQQLVHLAYMDFSKTKPPHLGTLEVLDCASTILRRRHG
ncbi:MAG: type II toxin-antitoxin system HicB family antitoxin [Proteobacteria bacterium]|nr:type II toxin-antitoxin system HicB family antitoxin [Pseudomonadota bacterium]